MRYYPVFLDLRGQDCLVLGATDLAAEKAAGLRLAGAAVRELAEYRPGALEGARLVFDATGEESVNRQVWEEAERLGILVNVVDRPERCRFIAPAVVNRDPLLVAISTSGESPFLASALRARLERWLGAEWGPFVERVGAIRRGLRREGVPLGEQTAVYRRLLRSGVRRLLRQGRIDDAAYEAAAIAASAGAPRAGRVSLVGAGPGDPALLTVAAQEALFDADVVFHDALVSPDTLALAGPQAELVDVGKRGGRGGAEQAAINAALIEAARAGRDSVRLKGGDPFVFGRGGEEMAALLEAGLEVVVVPGVSSALAAPAAAGIPLTLRGVAASFAVATAQSVAGGADLERLAAAADTLVVLMPLANLEATLGRIGAVLGAERPAALVSAATSERQAVVRGTLGTLHGRTVDSPAVLVVGDVVDALPVSATAAVAAGFLSL